MEVDAHPHPGCGRQLVQSARQAPFGRVVQGCRPQLGSGQSRVDDGDARIDKTVGGSPHGLGIEPTEARRCFGHEHGRPLDGDGADLGHDVARPRSARGEAVAVVGDAEHPAHDDGLGDGSSDLGVAPYQRGADLLQGSSDRPEQLFHRKVRRAGRKQDGGQEPPGPHTHDRDVVGIHDHREPTHVRARQRDRIGRHDQHAGRDGDGAPVFADRRANKDLRRESREPVEHGGEEVGGDLPGKQGSCWHRPTIAQNRARMLGCGCVALAEPGPGRALPPLARSRSDRQGQLREGDPVVSQPPRVRYNRRSRATKPHIIGLEKSTRLVRGGASSVRRPGARPGLAAA